MEQVDEVGRLSQALSESASMQAEAVRMADQAADKVEEQKKEIEVQPHEDSPSSSSSLLLSYSSAELSLGPQRLTAALEKAKQQPAADNGAQQAASRADACEKMARLHLEKGDMDAARHAATEGLSMVAGHPGCTAVIAKCEEEKERLKHPLYAAAAKKKRMDAIEVKAHTDEDQGTTIQVR